MYDAEGKTPRQRYLERLTALQAERASWLPSWQELAEYTMPRSGRFVDSDRNRGDKKHQKVINGIPLWAARTLSAGMMSGMTPQARPWFRLTTHDLDLGEYASVKRWLAVVEERIRLVFAKSNLYFALPTMYKLLGVFGAAAMIVEEDADDLMRVYVLPIGSFCLANSSELRVDTLYRDRFQMTTAQLVKRFGLEACSPRVRDQYARRQLDVWHKILHVIEPNLEYTPGRIGYRGKKWKSCWMELDAEERHTALLHTGGFYEFPVMAPRWDVTGEDVYGSSPGMDAIGDAKALQLLEKRKLTAVEKIINPPMRGSAALKNERISLLPGDITYVPGVDPSAAFAPAIIVPPQAVGVVGAEIREHEGRIKQAMYADLWLMLSASDNPQMTAREIAERHEEKMLQLGPVTERLHDELIDPLIERTFNLLLRLGYIPPPPPELQGQDLQIDHISIMAQAQKLLGTTSVERLASFTGNLAAVKPEVLDKVDFDKMVEEYAEMLGVPPDLIRSEEDVAAFREARAKQQQALEAQAAAGQAVQGAKVLSETNVTDDNALTRLVRNMAGAALGAPE